LYYFTNVLFPVLVAVVWFVQVSSVNPFWQGWFEVEGIVCLCRLSWSFLFGRVGLLFWTAIKEVTLCMIIGLVLESLWCLSWSKKICGSFWLLAWPDWEVVKCFCGFFWFTHPPRRIELLMLVIGFLVQLSLLQRYGLVV